MEEKTHDLPSRNPLGGEIHSKPQGEKIGGLQLALQSFLKTLAFSSKWSPKQFSQVGVKRYEMHFKIVKEVEVARVISIKRTDCK